MSTLFSGASISETGGINGAKGDQTGKEVRTTNAYMHSLGWRVFRHPNSNIAYWIGENARVMAERDFFGYGQADRTSGYIACKNAGWEPKNVNYNCNLDCSELVRTCIACAMEQDIVDFNTASEPSVLLSLGFEEVKSWSLDSLCFGDIVCTKSKGHTEVVTSKNNSRAEATTPSQNNVAIDSAKSKSNNYNRKFTTTANLNMRTGAGTSKSIITTLPEGTDVKCNGYFTTYNDKDWLVVVAEVNGKSYTGYCHENYLE